jgi:hypothetical protein
MWDSDLLDVSGLDIIMGAAKARLARPISREKVVALFSDAQRRVFSTV